MPVKKQVTMSQKTSSVVVTTKVMESRSSLTSLKTVTHERNSSGKMIETWSSPSLMLTSPQTWVSGLQAKFLSPPKSPSPKRRITRRSSVYVNPAWSKKSKLSASPKGLEFKIPDSSITSLSSTRSRQSSVFQKSGGEPTISRRSSVYRKNTKSKVGNADILEQEEPEMGAEKGKKLKTVSPKNKTSKLPVGPGKKSKSPVKGTRTRKRNVSELEKEDSPERPVTKRRKQAVDESINLPSTKQGQSLQKGKITQSETSAATDTSTSSPLKTSRKEPKRAARKMTKKVAQSLSPQSSSAKSVQRASPKKSDKSPSSSRKGSKSSVGPRKAQSSPQRTRAVKGKKPSSPRKAAKSVEPSSPGKAAKSPSPKRTRSAKSFKSSSPSSVRKGSSSPSKQKAKGRGVENAADDKSSVENRSVIRKTPKRKRTAKDDTPVLSPKPKSAKLAATPQPSPPKKSARSSPNIKSEAKRSNSKKAKSKMTVTRKSSAPDEVVTYMKSSHLDSVTLEEGMPGKEEGGKFKDSKQKKTPSKKGGKKANVSKQDFTPKSPSLKRQSQTLSVSSGKKTSEKKRRHSEQTAADSFISSEVETQASSKKTSGSSKPKATDTPTSNKKRSTPAKSGGGKKATSSKSGKSNRSRDTKGSISTPKSAMKSKGKSRKSSTKKSSSVHSRSAGHKAAAGNLDISDSLDGSYLQISGQQSTKSSHKSSISTKKTQQMDAAVKSAEDEKILKILEKAVSSTPKKQLTTPKSTNITMPKSAKGFKKSPTPRLQQNGKKRSTPKNLNMTEPATSSKETRQHWESSHSSVTLGTGPRSTLRQAEAAEERILGRRGLLTPLTHQTGKASASRMRSGILSRDHEDLLNGDHQLKKFNIQDRAGLSVAQASRQGKTYQEETSFAQYVEYRANSGIERYGTQAVERRLGDQTYRSGRFHVEQKKGSQMETEHEECRWGEGDVNDSTDGETFGAGRYHAERNKRSHREIEHAEDEWEEGDVNNSADSSDDANANISTSTYASRCIIL